MRKKTIYTLLIFLSFMGIILISKAQPSLDVTVTTDKQTYYLGEYVQIYGNLTLDGSPVLDGLVAIQTDDPTNTPYIYRTLPTGTPPTEGWIIEILEVIPCDYYGNPKDNFDRGTTAYLKITIRNNDNVSRRFLLAYTIFDSNEVPIIAWDPLRGSIPPGNSTLIHRSASPIPGWASLGTAHVYVNVFTESPKDGGTPYSPEKSATFTITAGSSSTTTSTSKTTYQTCTEGTYNLTFRLPSLYEQIGEVGNFTIYASSSYGEQNATDSTTFEVIIPPLIGDINDDGLVDMRDIGIACAAYGSYPGHPNWDARADLNGDELVDMRDIGIICAHYGEEI